MTNIRSTAPSASKTLKDCPPETAASGTLLLDVEEAAAELHIAPWTVRQLARAGTIPRVVIPSPSNPGRACRKILIPRAGLVAYIASITEGGDR